MEQQTVKTLSSFRDMREQKTSAVGKCPGIIV